MDTIRSLNRLRWWVVVWCLLSLGTALASPVIQPRTVELICSGGSGTTLVVHSGSGSSAPDGPGMDCSQCLLGAAPPPPAPQFLPALAPPRLHPVPPPVVLAMAPTARPPPARAPPFSVC